jgi:hypothetical protein
LIEVSYNLRRLGLLLQVDLLLDLERELGLQLLHVILRLNYLNRLVVLDVYLDLWLRLLLGVALWLRLLTGQGVAILGED